MTLPFPRLVAVLTIATTALLVSACSSPATQTEPTPSATADSAATEPAAEPEPTQTAEAEAEPATCENIISATTVADFESLGWTSLADVFQVGSVQIPEGIQCIWGDFTTASDHVQIFGWAPITAAQAQTAQNDLVAEGWTLEQAPEGVYVTESSQTTVATDENGYGLTYLFGEGWVKFADTKQGLILVEWQG